MLWTLYVSYKKGVARADKATTTKHMREMLKNLESLRQYPYFKLTVEEKALEYMATNGLAVGRQQESNAKAKSGAEKVHKIVQKMNKIDQQMKHARS